MHLGRSRVLDFIFSCASSGFDHHFIYPWGSVLFIRVSQPMISSKGCAFFPSQDGQVWAGKTKAKLLRAKSPRYLGTRSPRYPMTNIA